AIIIGMGHLGKAISNYFNSNRSNIKIIAAFDKDQTKVDRIISGIKSYHIENLNKIIKSDNCKIAILSMSPKDAQNVADALIYNGIKGIMNFTSVPLNVPETVYVENYDMITSIEKVAYYVKKN
ncbi:MAG: redox-sensing transcriptional repressor Rex, partial [Bacteroidales bacterium]|nr:redox-sensing transcriptional repressor Rex [Bacteroidales bacterium]